MCCGGEGAGRPATKHMQRDRTRAVKSITNTQASVSVARVRKNERESDDSSPQFEVLVSQLSQMNLLMRHTRAFASSFGTRLTARSDWQPAGCGSDATASCLPCVLRVRSSRAAAAAAAGWLRRCAALIGTSDSARCNRRRCRCRCCCCCCLCCCAARLSRGLRRLRHLRPISAHATH